MQFQLPRGRKGSLYWLRSVGPWFYDFVTQHSKEQEKHYFIRPFEKRSDYTVANVRPWFFQIFFNILWDIIWKLGIGDTWLGDTTHQVFFRNRVPLIYFFIQINVVHSWPHTSMLILQIWHIGTPMYASEHKFRLSPMFYVSHGTRFIIALWAHDTNLIKISETFSRNIWIQADPNCVHATTVKLPWCVLNMDLVHSQNQNLKKRNFHVSSITGSYTVCEDYLWIQPSQWCYQVSIQIGCYDDRIALKFDRHLGNAAAEVPVKFLGAIGISEPESRGFEISRGLVVRRPPA